MQNGTDTFGERCGLRGFIPKALGDLTPHESCQFLPSIVLECMHEMVGRVCENG